MSRILVYNFNPLSVNNAHLGFEELGYPVLACACQERNLGNDILERELNSLIDSFKPDVVFSYGWWAGRVDIEYFCEIIKQKGIFHVYWAFDDPQCYETISLPVGKKADLLFTSVEESIKDYKNNNVNAHLLVHGCYPPDHKGVAPNLDFKHDLVLLAHNYNIKTNPEYFSYRFNGINNIIRPMVELNYDLMVWGLWWDGPDRIYNLPAKNYGLALPYGLEAAIYSSCKIALGLQSVGDSISHFSVRTFEILACGAFHLSQYSPALEHFFTKGVHMEWSQSPEETIDLVNFYLQHDSLREKIGLQGQQEVLQKHTLKHRAQFAMKIINKYL